MSASLDEPAIPPRLQRPLAAVWISLGLHAAVIALVQVAPPASMNVGEPVIEARLVTRHAGPVDAELQPLVAEAEMPLAPPEKVPLLVPGETAETLPVATPPDLLVPPAAPEAAAPAPAAAIISSVDLTYYSARDVDVHPRALREIVPDYPVDADRKQVSGKVRLQLKLEADGRISDIEVVSATPPGLFDESALRAFRDARFAPAQKGGHPVRALVLIEVVYDWEGRVR
jgi:protein TonB